MRLGTYLEREFPERETYKPFVFPKFCRSNGIIRFKQSRYWVQDYQFEKKRCFVFPHINKNGEIEWTSYGVWKTYPSILFASILSTVYKRIEKILFYHRDRKHRVSRYLIFQIALKYVVSGDIHIMRRMIECGKRSGKSLRKMIYHCRRTEEDEYRFLSDHAESFGLWFQHRSAPKNAFRAESVQNWILSKKLPVGTKSNLSKLVKQIDSWATVLRSSVGKLPSISVVSDTSKEVYNRFAGSLISQGRRGV